MILYYLIFFFLILRFTIALFNFISNPKLTYSLKHYDEQVSILIPVRNEAPNIFNLLNSIKNQSYSNYEVIVLDDGSTDNSYAVASEFADSDKRFRVLRGKELPEDWLGKNYACYQLAQEARGKYLMFIDADEEIKEGLINNSVHRMKINRIALLSLFANQKMETVGEKLVVPLMHLLLLYLLPLRLVKLSSNPALAAASGQFMLFDAEVYQKEQWHLKVKSKVVEDIEIMKCVKRSGYTGEALLANGYIFCRMYTDYKEAINGFSKNLLAGFGYNVAALVCYLLLVMLGPVFIFFYLNLTLLSFLITLIILTRLLVSLQSGQSILQNIVFHPLQMVSLIIISVVSVKKYLTKTTTWKGRTIINGE
ncbi:glycosyltransferase [Rubrolithibacter danxiaensis]|uniref:glycosyltransferase n=1 Tax=Rubrolithibacter danxiaensis TaxID=3390805 RepID=UPI003BF86234